MLVGDPADNIKGVANIGRAKAPKLLDGCETEQELYKTVLDLYPSLVDFELNADLLWIFRKENDRWSLNRGKSLKQEPEAVCESTPEMVEAPTDSTVPILTN